MKKLVFCTIVLLSFIWAVSCSRGVKKIDIDNVTESTLLAKKNGELQVATVEDFDKPYYSLKELQGYVDKELTAYNDKNGGKKIKVASIQIVNKKAIMLLNYTGMDQYAAFNNVTAAYFNGGVKDIPLTLPTTLINAKDESLASTQEIIHNDKYKILLLNEPYHIVVDGKIKYYSEGLKPIDDNEIQGASEGMSIVVFKP